MFIVQFLLLSIMASTCSTCSTSNVGDRSIVVFSKVILYIQLSHYSSDSWLSVQILQNYMTTFCQTARLAKYFTVDPKAKSLHGLFSDRPLSKQFILFLSPSHWIKCQICESLRSAFIMSSAAIGSIPTKLCYGFYVTLLEFWARDIYFISWANSSYIPVIPIFTNLMFSLLLSI